MRIRLILAASFVACVRPSVMSPPSTAWTQYATPADAGFSALTLDSVRAYADSSKAAAVMAVYRGKVLVAWGDVHRKFQLHSVRKSLVSALYGTALDKINLDAALGDLGVDDVGKLTAQEKTARVRDLIAARSGVYLNGAYGGVEQSGDRPRRGTYAPGTHWFYNNWDFNLAGVLYERFTGESLYVAFAQRIAAPIGMEDYDPRADGWAVLEPTSSMYPAHTFGMSTRDLARFGQLYLQRGTWNGRQVVPAEWVTRSTTPMSSGRADGFREGVGYGYMWWTYAPGSAGAELPLMNRQHVIAASGTGGQAVFIVPNENFVIVVRGDTDNGPGLAGGRAWRIAEGILRAKTSAVSDAKTIALASVPFASQKPAPPPLPVIVLDAAKRAEFVGSYRMQGPEPARVFVFQDRLYGYIPGMGDAELVAIGPDEFTIRVQPGVSVRFERDASGAIRSMRATISGRTLTAARVPAG